MFWIVNSFFYLLAITVLIPSMVLLLECLAAVTLTPKIPESKINPNLHIAILIPAHNEASGITQTLLSLLSEVDKATDIIVVADNCTDATAEIARQQGVTVLERSNEKERGKGYALDYGLQHLALSSPDIVVLVDADCQVSPKTIQNISQLSWSTGQPVQVTYLMEKPPEPSSKDLISALAFLVKNQVRMLGLSIFGLPCPLQGTGMAFPFTLLQQVSLSSGNIVEDMQLGIDLALQGHPTLFYPEGRVISALPQETTTAKTQRTRWEHGHLNTLLTQVPLLLKAAIMQRRLDLFALALDLAVPPLSLLVLLWLLTTVVNIIGVVFGLSSLTPLLLTLLAGTAILVSIVLSWAKFARQEISLGTLLKIPFYILWKIPIYFSFLLRREQKWVKTERN